MTFASPLAPGFTVRYASRQAANQLLADPGTVLGIVGYGAPRPALLPASCPFVSAPLQPASGAPMFEIWRSASPTRLCEAGPVIGAHDGDLAFGAITLDEAAHATLEDAVEAAYLHIFDFLDVISFPEPIRFWNYLNLILAEDHGLERYRRFNIGRQRAFSARLRQALPPAASGVGGHEGKSVIYFLAACRPARPVENPRQVSAYSYPPAYGPASPSFSRAGLFTQGDITSLFISGTASITGHLTRHQGDLSGQIAETSANLRALIGAAGAEPSRGAWAVKAYLHNAADRAALAGAIRAVFGVACQLLVLRGEICRPGLLMEIEAFGQYARR